MMMSLAHINASAKIRNVKRNIPVTKRLYNDATGMHHEGDLYDSETK